MAPNVIAEATGEGLWVSDLGGDPKLMEQIRAWIESRGLALSLVEPVK